MAPIENRHQNAKVDAHNSSAKRRVDIKELIDNVVTALSDVAKLPEAKILPVSIGRCIQQVANTTTTPDNVEVVQEFPENLPAVWADENQIAIAFRNLLRNARDAMPRGGRITISARQVDSQLAISFRDEGVGIPAEDIGLITEPFYSTKARGIGLGLAITRGIVASLQGTIRFETPSCGGTCFIVNLPFEDVPETEV